MNNFFSSLVMKIIFLNFMNVIKKLVMINVYKVLLPLDHDMQMFDLS